jgi:hypothetical protein
MKDRVASLGGEVYQGSITEANQYIQQQMQEWAKIIREKNISPN